MDNLRKVVDEKKIKSATRRPKYGMRKLSIGLVSCTLGFITFAAPNVVSAQVNQPEAIVEKHEGSVPSDGVVEREINKEAIEAPANEAENTSESTFINENKVTSDKKLEETLAVERSAPVESETPSEVSGEKLEEGNKQEEAALVSDENAPQTEESSADNSKANEEKPAKKYEKSKIIEDEKNITDNGGYRQSEIAGQGPKVKVNDNIGEEKEGVRVEVQNPSSTSDDKKSFGVELNIDKTKSDRTYNGFAITDSVRGVKTEGEGRFLSKGESLPTNKEDKVTYKPNDPEEGSLIPGRQTRFEYSSTQKDREHIANQNTGKTTMAWQGKYTQPNPNEKLLNGGSNFEVAVGVNPYPNENKDLSLITIEGNKTISKAPVKNQYIVSKASIKNAGDEDYTRLVGEVYHPDEDIIVEGAKALIVTSDNIENMKKETGDNTLTIGQIVFKMPEGALQNNNSIFNDNKFKGVQNLRAKFFARPRTKEEFSNLANNLKGFDGDTTFGYESTGAGTKKIMHNGTEVEIDQQGIARYDHYNLIGEMTINLDDTKHYNPEFINQAGEKTSENEYTSVKPGETSKVEFSKKLSELSGGLEGVGEDSKLNDYVEKGYATGVVSETFLKEINKGKPKNKQWNIKLEKGDKEQLTVIAPKDAKPGEFVAIPVIYTYTNGSQDVKWFHFVVQDNENHRPEYKADIGYQGDKLVNTPEIPTDPEGTKEEDKKKTPQSFELAKPVYTDENGNELEAGKYKKKDGTIIDLKPGEYVDSAGNVWTDVEINPKTGEVTATVPKDVNIEGGENLFVPVKVNYEDGKSIEVSSQFIARPRYYESDTHEVKSEIPFDTNVVYDDKLEAGVVVKTEGEVGEKQTIYEWSFDSLEKDPSKRVLVNTTETVVKEKKDAEIRIGIKPAEERVTIPHTIEYIVDPSLKPGEEEIEEVGVDGEVKVKTTRDAVTGKISITKEETTAMTPMKVKIGVYNHTNKDPFETKVVEDKTLPAGTIEKTEGVVGETETKIIPAKIADMDDMMKTIGEDKFLGENNTPNYDAIANYMVKKGFWDKDKIKKTTREDGKVTGASYDGKRFEALLNFNAKNSPTGKVLVPGRVETKEKTKKQDKVIKVGTKPVEGTTTDINKEVSVDIEYVNDETLDKGVVKTGDLIPGKTETKIVSKIVNGKVVNEEVTVVTPAKQKIIVGTNDICKIPEGPDTLNPGEDNPVNPGKTEKPNEPSGNNPNKPAGDTPDVPNEPGERPNNPVTPSPENPGDSKPNSPVDSTPIKPDEPNSNKPVEPTRIDPSVPSESTPNNPREMTPSTSEEESNSSIENKSTLDETSIVDEKTESIKSIESIKKEEKVKDSNEFDSTKKSRRVDIDGYSKEKSLTDNPKTYDAGVAGYAGLGGLASAVLAAFEMKRRKKDK